MLAQCDHIWSMQTSSDFHGGIARAEVVVKDGRIVE